MATKKQRTVDDYIASLPEEARRYLTELREVIRQALPPGANEAVRYNMAAFQVDGRDIVYFAAWKKHVALYSLSEEMLEEIPELAKHRTSTATVRFEFDEPVPADLVTRFVKWRLERG